MAVKNLIFLMCLFHTQFYSVFGQPPTSDNEVVEIPYAFMPLESVSKIGYEGHSAVIPCLPTSPEYNVSLYAEKHYQDYESIDLDRITFDPHVGFTIHQINSNDRRRYKCKFLTNPKDDSQFVIYELINVIDAPTVKIVNTPKYAIKGDDFHFECQIHPLLVRVITNFSVKWRAPNGKIYPQNFSSSDARISTSMKILNKVEGKSSLKIKNVTYNDAGTYACEFESWDLRLAAKKTIDVQENQLISVHMSSPSLKKYTFVDPGEDLELFATIVTKLNNLEGIEVKWLFHYKEFLVTNDKYQITTTKNSTTLVIKNVNKDDVGTYTVQVINGRKVQTADIYLHTWDRSVIFTTKFEPSYKPLTEIQIQSRVNSLPFKRITWYFQKYLDSGEYEEPGELLKNFSVNNKSMDYTISTLSLKLTTTGKVICKACFLEICSTKAKTIVVTDDNLEITKSKDIIIEERNITTTCSASLYYYNNITWQNQNGQIINDTDRIKISSQKDVYNIYKSTMEIKSVKISDKAAYKCVAVAKNGTIIWKEEKLLIKEISVDINSNMNGSTRVVDEETARTTIIVLTCYVSGVPTRPKISWSKDGDPIIENSTVYEFLNETQELRIIHPKKEHSGLYICKAQISQKFKEVSQTIVIKGNHLIMSIVLGITIPILACIIFGIYYITVWRSKKAEIDLTSEGLANFEEGDVDNLHSQLSADDQVLCLPYNNKKWEFPRENLKFQKRLGYGQFGVVMKAKAREICEQKTVTTVAVKMLRKSKSRMYLKALASELKILSHIGRHLNIVNLLGACTSNISKGELLIIVEYCSYGSLHCFLRKYRNNFVNQIEPTVEANNSQSPDGGATESIAEITNGNSLNAVPRKRRKGYSITITTQDLLAWAFQVARGMQYLGQRRVFHGDLAARNVLLTDNNVVKICDFGLARNLYHYALYQKTSNDPLPLKWMAVESIRDRIFSTQSDVWSFGIFLWEIFTLASTPYPEFRSLEVYQKLIAGYRMGKSEYMTDEIYSVMLQCWNVNPALRPTFSELEKTVGSMLPKILETHFIELNSPYVQFNEAESHGARDYLSLVSRPDLGTLMSRSDNEYLMNSERRAADDSSVCSLDPGSNPAGLPNTRHEENDNSPSLSQRVSVPSNHPPAPRRVTFLKSMLLGRIVGFKNPYYISADDIITP